MVIYPVDRRTVLGSYANLCPATVDCFPATMNSPVMNRHKGLEWAKVKAKLEA